MPADNPLILSGLAMAGANRRQAAGADRDDGILTAEEVTALNLRGVEWAVLSACDTGLGELKAGEGVLGLRRAFQIAGARTIIMSLWAVDDDAVRTWMHGLYVGRLQRRLNTADAMHQASLDALRERRTHGSRWRSLLSMNGAAWLQLAASAADERADLYDGRLGNVQSPVLFVHGGRDPRTEPGELDALQTALPDAQMAVLPGAFHSPHRERATADAVTDLLRRFFELERPQKRQQI